mmetsp:Transcript_58781/g.70731  ORF Transcript_58781/g.70731 Transcript_58781/m.70731 type:complete len:234 (+) Transcript_58781:326-1027(+)
MPGSRMRERPKDFDEELVKRAPTFKKWEALKNGEKMRYFSREFIKGRENDEERIMRRIMIARRNNIRDHEMVKKARASKKQKVNKENSDKFLGKGSKNEIDQVSSEPLIVPGSIKKRKFPCSVPTNPYTAEMDEQAVQETRSYKAWRALENGQVFTYNHKYIKGKEGHDWLLKKNIWRRIKYRRKTKRMVCDMMKDAVTNAIEASHAPAADVMIVDKTSETEVQKRKGYVTEI